MKAITPVIATVMLITVGMVGVTYTWFSNMMAPNRAITLINGYPVFAKGKYTVRVGTRNGVMERTVECL